MARDTEHLRHGDTFTFTNDHVGLYKIVAHKGGTDGTEESSIYATRTIRIINPTPIGDITPGSDIISGFIAGEDTKYFSILYSLTPEYEYTLDELNNAAYIYIKEWNDIVSDDKRIPINDRPNERPLYFGQDNDGIYALLDITGDSTNDYDQSIVYSAGDHTYVKAYVKGTCSIVDVDYSNTNDFNMTPSIAYPLTFQNDNGRVPYLFINSSIQLLYSLSADSLNTGTFKILGSIEEIKYALCTDDKELLMNKSLSYYQNTENVNYILKFAELNKNEYKINTISEPLDSVEDEEKRIAMMITSGTNRKIIIPETVKKISHFFGPGNPVKIILPSSLIEIGEYAFYHINNGSISLRAYNNSLKIIGKKAFANIGNVRIFEFDIAKDKEFIIANMCRDDSDDISKLSLNREQLSGVLDTLISKSVKTICLLPRVERIKEYAFQNASIGTSIANIAFSNIERSVGAYAFKNAGIKNLIIPDPLIVRPESSDRPDTISSSGLLYLPETAIDLACRDLDSTYTYEMKDTIHIDQGTDTNNGDGYDYTNTSNLTWLNDNSGNKYKRYKDLSTQYRTFSGINQASDQTYYFIHKINS